LPAPWRINGYVRTSSSHQKAVQLAEPLEHHVLKYRGLFFLRQVTGGVDDTDSIGRKKLTQVLGDRDRKIRIGIGPDDQGWSLHRAERSE
jgi:hypothetical protein